MSKEGWAIPRDYRCQLCGAARVRLWAGPKQRLFCASCKQRRPEAEFEPSFMGPEETPKKRWGPVIAIPTDLLQWWGSMPFVEGRRFLEIESDQDCLAIVRQAIGEETKTQWPDNQEILEQALEAVVAAGLAPQEWMTRYALWLKETDDRQEQIRRHGYTSMFLQNVIDPRALDAILLNPKSVVTAERILLDHIDPDHYLGVRSWKALLYGESGFSGMSSSVRPESHSVTGSEAVNAYDEFNNITLGHRWSCLLRECGISNEDVEIVRYAGAALLGHGESGLLSPWCQEIAALGLAVIPWRVIDGEYPTTRWAITARRDGAPWPMFGARIHRGEVSWDDPSLIWENEP